MKTGFVTTLETLVTYYPTTKTTSLQLNPSLINCHNTEIIHNLRTMITPNHLQHGAKLYQRGQQPTSRNPMQTQKQPCMWNNNIGCKNTNNTKKYSAQNISIKKLAIVHQMDTADSYSIKRTKKTVKRNKMWRYTDVNFIDVDYLGEDTPFM